MDFLKGLRQKREKEKMGRSRLDGVGTVDEKARSGRGKQRWVARGGVYDEGREGIDGEGK